MAAIVHDVADAGEEDPGKSKSVYLVTFSHPQAERSIDGHVLQAPGNFTREAVRDALLGALAACQAARATPLVFRRMVVFREAHGSGHVHYHIAVAASRCFRFLPIKRALLTMHGLASHWSCSHDHYASCVAYGYMPSPTKSASDCDQEPLLWATPGSEHPPLSEASRPPITAAALTARREQVRRERGAAGGAERFKAVDLWPIVVQENITTDIPGCAERVMSYARRCGGPAMVEFCFNNHPKLEDLVARSWQMEKVEDLIAGPEKPRQQFVAEAAQRPCICQGRWFAAASELFRLNSLDAAEWRAAVRLSLERGRSKGNLVCHTGKEGDEGKSFLFAPFYSIFGEEAVFTAPPKNVFPLLELPKARLVILDDWRFNEDIVSYPLQLLWFEGQPFVIARPQNQFSGHIRYRKDDPVFITTLEADLHSLSQNLLPGDRDMMLKRLKIFRFHQKLPNLDRPIPPCGHCLACFLLTGSPGGQAGGSDILLPVASHRKRAASWSVEDVAAYLRELELGHLAEQFQQNGVDGQMIVDLSQEDMVNDLGLTRLQARKVANRLP